MRGTFGYPLEEPTLLFTRRAMLLEEAEGSLARLVALAGEELQSLRAGLHLAAANNAGVLVLDEILLLQATRGVLGRSVENLSLGTNSHFKFGHLILLTAIFLLSPGGGAKVD